MKAPTQMLGLAGWGAACFAAAAIGGWASASAPEFYGQLSRPDWAPPAALFGPVWTVLYALMALAAWLVWRQHGFAGGCRALMLFAAQLVANALWSWLFFAWHQGALAFLDILALLILIGLTVLAFWKLNRVAALLLMPYFGWVSFAAALNFTVWRMNPALLG